MSMPAPPPGHHTAIIEPDSRGRFYLRRFFGRAPKKDGAGAESFRVYVSDDRTTVTVVRHME